MEEGKAVLKCRECDGPLRGNRRVYCSAWCSRQAANGYIAYCVVCGVLMRQTGNPPLCGKCYHKNTCRVCRTFHRGSVWCPKCRAVANHCYTIVGKTTKHPDATARVEVYAARAEAGLPLWQEGEPT